MKLLRTDVRRKIERLKITELLWFTVNIEHIFVTVLDKRDTIYKRWNFKRECC